MVPRVVTFNGSQVAALANPAHIGLPRKAQWPEYWPQNAYCIFSQRYPSGWGLSGYLWIEITKAGTIKWQKPRWFSKNLPTIDRVQLLHGFCSVPDLIFLRAVCQ